MINLNEYQTKLYAKQRTDLGVLPPAILALGLAERTGEVCSYIFEHTVGGSVVNSPELTADARNSIGILIAYAVQLYASLDINAEESLSAIFDGLLRADNSQRSGAIPDYIYGQNDIPDQNQDLQNLQDKEQEPPEEEEKSVFEQS